MAKFESIENIRVSNNVKLNLIRVDLDLFEINIDNEEENIINKVPVQFLKFYEQLILRLYHLAF